MLEFEPKGKMASLKNHESRHELSPKISVSVRLWSYYAVIARCKKDEAANRKANAQFASNTQSDAAYA